MTPPTCPHCHAPVNPGARFCTTCGQPIPAMRSESACPACGKPHAPTARFCIACGRPLLPAAPPPAPVTPISVQPTSAAKPARRKKLPVLLGVAAGIACLCLLAAAIAAGVIFVPRFLETPQPVSQVNDPDPTSTPQPAGPNDPPTQTPELSTIEPTPSFTPTMTLEPSPTPSPTLTPRPEGRPFVGELAPEFTLLDANTGEAITLSDFTGHPVMVNFWATWCGYCEDEMPYMQAAYEARQAEGLVILAIDYEEYRTDVVNYGRDHNLTFTLLLDEDGAVTDNDYRVTGFPTSFFIFPDGTISFIQLGSMTSEEINQQLDVIMSP